MKNGFTLVELLIVVAIIGLLATLSIITFRETRTKARIAKAQYYMGQVSLRFSMLATDTELWPGKQAVGVVCTDLPGGCPANNEICGDGCAYGLSDAEAGLTSTDGNYPAWAGPYMDNIDLDPWGNEYFFDTDYNYNGDNVAVIGSYGPNGVGSNAYDDDDVIIILAR